MNQNKTILIAELGGTNARLAITEDGKSLKNRYETKLEDSKSAEQLFRGYCSQIVGIPIRRAIIGVAAPMLGEEVKLTNSNLEFNKKKLETLFSKQLLILNDLELQAHAIEALEQKEIRRIGNVTESKKGSKILVSPGTGLGLAGIVDGVVIFTEAGHINIPSGLKEFKSIIKKFEKEKSRMPTFEDFLSGKGINYIFCYLNASEVSNFSNEEILANTQDQNCLKTKDLIVYLLAVYLRYVALIWGATSGVYISGSMANTLLESINHTTFRTEFENSPTMKELLLKIPIYLIKELDLGLRGGLQLATKG